MSLKKHHKNRTWTLLGISVSIFTLIQTLTHTKTQRKQFQLRVLTLTCELTDIREALLFPSGTSAKYNIVIIYIP